MFSSPKTTKRAAGATSPLFALSAAFAAGIFFTGRFDIDPFVLLLLFIPAAVALIFARNGSAVFVLVCFLCAGAFAIYIEITNSENSSIRSLYKRGWVKSGDPVSVTGQLTDQPRNAPNGFYALIEVNTIRYKRELIPASGLVRVFIKTESGNSKNRYSDLALKAGNEVRFSVRLKREEPFRNPGMVSLIQSLEKRGISAYGTVPSALLIEKLDGRKAFLSPAFELREWLTNRILETQNRKDAGIVLAALLGNKHFLTKDSGDLFRENGTFHVLVISGLHITVIGGILLFFVSRVTGNRMIRFAVSNLALWVYAAMVGLEIPVVRAALMFSIYLSAYGLKRASNPLNSLSAAAISILVWRPHDLLNPSFQLTYLSIFAITVFALPVIKKLKAAGSWFPEPSNPFPPEVSRPFRLFTEALYWSELRWKKRKSQRVWDCEIEKTRIGHWMADTILQRILRRVFEVAFVSFCVQMFLLPLLVLNFHRVGAASVVSNLFAGAAVGIQSVFALIGVLISLIDSPSSDAFGWLSYSVGRVSAFLQSMMSVHLLRPSRLPVYTGLFSAVYPLFYISLAFVVYCFKRWDPFEFAGLPKKRKRGVLLTLAFTTFTLAAVIVFHPLSAPFADGRLRVDFLDVGQGDAALITFPDGRTMLVDGGGQRDFDESADGERRDVSGIGERVVSEFLWEKGMDSLDFVLATHPDADHINGLADVLRNFSVGRAIVGAEYEGLEEYERFLHEAKRKNVPISVLTEGAIMNIGGAEILVLNPETEGETGSTNNDSVVFRVSLGGRSFLFTGDIESESEKRICEGGLLVSSDVVKAAHHGSRTSSSTCFVEKADAEYIVIPVGRRSPYGHPHVEVVERWKRAGGRVYILGETGALTFSTDGLDLRINANSVF